TEGGVYDPATDSGGCWGAGLVRLNGAADSPDAEGGQGGGDREPDEGFQELECPVAAGGLVDDGVAQRLPCQVGVALGLGARLAGGHLRQREDFPLGGDDLVGEDPRAWQGLDGVV